VGFVVDEVALRQVFSPSTSVSPANSHFFHMLHGHLSSGAGIRGPLVADVPSGRSLTPPQEIKKKPTGILIKLVSNVRTESVVTDRIIVKPL
jgi:hypothetical protein